MPLPWCHHSLLKEQKCNSGDKEQTTDANGIVKFEFENVSVNNYTLIVRGAPNSGFIPKSVNLKSEETKNSVLKTVELEAGSEVSGVVKLDGVPGGKRKSVYRRIQYFDELLL